MDNVTWQAIMAGMRAGIDPRSPAMDEFIRKYKEKRNEEG